MLLTTCVLLSLLLKVSEMVDLDTWLFLNVQGGYGAGWRTLLRSFTDLGSLTIWLLLVPLLWLGRKREAAITLLIALMFVFLIGNSLKFIIDRPRPYEVLSQVDPLYRLSDPSFPSGHTMNAFAGAIAIGKKWQITLLPLLILAAAIGFSRVYIGVHYPFDVISGASIGILIGLLADSLDLHGPIDRIGSCLKTLVNKFSNIF
jgi:undecaprenyl-diphosphatase